MQQIHLELQQLAKCLNDYREMLMMKHINEVNGLSWWIIKSFRIRYADTMNFIETCLICQFYECLQFYHHISRNIWYKNLNWIGSLKYIKYAWNRFESGIWMFHKTKVQVKKMIWCIQDSHQTLCLFLCCNPSKVEDQYINMYGSFNSHIWSNP